MRVDISNSTEISNVIFELYGVQIKNTIKGITTDSRNLIMVIYISPLKEKIMTDIIILTKWTL